MLRFRKIILLILGGISLLFLLNIFFLRGLWNSMEAETRQLVDACIEKADAKEMQLRLTQFSKRAGHQERSIILNKSFDNDTLTTTQRISSKEGADDSVAQTRKSTEPFDLESFERFPQELRSVVHQNMDSILPVDLHRLDSLLRIEMRGKEVLSEVYGTQIVDLRTGTTLRSSLPAAWKPSTAGYVTTYTYAPAGQQAYRVWMGSLNSVVLRQMSGILLSTLLIILLLAIAFAYLIRTVMRQKSLEELKDDFTNNMTHELKTPIAVAYSATDTLLNFRQGDDKEKREKYLRICLEQLSKLSGLVEQILSMSMERRKTVSLNKEVVEIEPFIRQWVELHRLKAGKEVEAQVHVHPPKMTVYADPIHLGNILSNLIDNAIKYSPAKAMLEIVAYEEDGMSVLTVKDHGIGIEAGHQKLLFDKFYRVPTGNVHNVKGYGLGLFYVRQMVEKHGGSVGVQSKPGQGTTFTLKFPRR
ncbi:MAG: GHKL domain-containing protein [Mediterranea sp.]|jgi:signal transduction histidine kinase|nr:GHKL domain-containing protein [Mediterranea sp.]